VIDKLGHIFNFIGTARRKMEVLVDLQIHASSFTCGLLNFSADNNIAGLDHDNFVLRDIGVGTAACQCGALNSMPGARRFSSSLVLGSKILGIHRQHCMQQHVATRLEIFGFGIFDFVV
jgi:hypothetical protein